MSEAILMVSFRDFSLRTLYGSINFVANVPHLVAPSIAQEALTYGIVPVDESSEIIKPEKEAKAIPTGKAERNAAIQVALDTMNARAGTAEGREDWTAARRPKMAVVAKLVGFKVHAEEINRIISDENERKEVEALAAKRDAAKGKKKPKAKSKKEDLAGGKDFGE
jgi:hypothetical protein